MKSILPQSINSIAALLPMKGNSERVKNKNMRNFNGSPLFHAITKTLLASKFISQVVINTDSNAIAENARNTFGDNVLIINRPETIRGDFVSMNDIIAYDVEKIEAEHFIQTHSTNPLLKTKTIDNAIKVYFENIDIYDSVFGVTKVQTRFYNKEARPINHNPEELLRTQDLEPYYEENSNLYIFSKSAFKNAGEKRICLKPHIFEINKLEAVDIDNEEDFILAELLSKYGERL